MHKKHKALSELDKNFLRAGYPLLISQPEPWISPVWGIIGKTTKCAFFAVTRFLGWLGSLRVVSVARQSGK